MLPLIASSMSASVGCGFSRSSTAADMIWPDWQYPHCGTSFSIHARCSGLLRSDERPSMVVTSLPAARETGVTHDRTASPLRWTVHAPHNAIPQPNFVPVNPKFSRTTQSSGVSGLTSTDCGFPLTFNRIIVCLLDQRETLPPICDIERFSASAFRPGIGRGVSTACRHARRLPSETVAAKHREGQQSVE